MKLALLFLALTLAATPALAQRDARKAERHMKDDERARMRDDMREAYRERQGRPERPRQLSQEEREKLRNDIEDANRQMKRRK